ncbi:VOC family protein [Snodgrassella sp. CFCC 13594]|uniref:VOC family protein n=1 Tax=Snodgrassella sp. CFCC 13594 TaxID=1775559 RepID=UPI00082C188F|nr:VOC family protein [Snodgrassella sp. CFCC 13594]
MAFTILGLDHILLRIEDKDSMLDFYLNVLGCTRERELGNLGLIQLRAGNSLIDLVPIGSPLGRSDRGTPLQKHANLDHLCLRIEPFNEDAIRQHFAEYGYDIEPSAIRYGADGFGASIYVHDPEGNTVELKGPPQAASEPD